MKVVLWSHGLLVLRSLPLVPCFPGPVVSWSCAPLVLWFLGPALPRSHGLSTLCYKYILVLALWFLWSPDLERELNMKYNKARHLLHWNRKVGKSIGAPDEGWIQCLKCGKKWRWKDRTNNLPRTVCVTTRPTRAKYRITKKTALSKLPRTRYFSGRADASLPFADVSLVDPPRVGVG